MRRLVPGAAAALARSIRVMPPKMSCGERPRSAANLGASTEGT
jgi:hypothetical protein